MSIKIPSPSIVFNHNTPKLVKYEMDNTYNIGNVGDIFMYLINNTNKVDEKRKKVFYESLVINCHGWPAHVYYGPLTGLKPDQPKNPYHVISWINGYRLREWRFPDGTPRAKTIYITSCDMVSFGNSRDGNLFCGWMAKQANAHVIASDAKQSSTKIMEKGYIDSYKGNVWEWLPDGSNRPWVPPKNDN